jgi:hypothetical protein
MTTNGTVFPAFIRAEYDGSNNAFAAFESDVDRSITRATSRINQFRESTAEVGRVLKAALANGNSLQLGKLDTGVSELRQLAAQARLTEAAVTQMYSSARTLAESTGDTTQATRLYLAALGNKVIEARADTAATEAQVTTYQRLQQALDATADKNNQLARSYRELYAEQAKLAQEEVAARRSQEVINELVAPATTRRATDNGAGFKALEEQVERRRELVARLNAEVAQMEQIFARAMADEARAAEQAAAAQRAHAAALDELRRQEAGAAEGARILQAIHQGTALEITRTGNSAQASAAVFERYDAAVREMVNHLNPAAAAMQTYKQQVEIADYALKQQLITEQQHTAILQRANTQMKTNTESTRSQRFAYLQLGQQMQDTAIQAQMGVSPFTILVQQGSQAAFAMSGLEGRVGKVASLLAGPWGAAVFGAVAALGMFITTLKDSEEATKGLELASDGLAETQSVLGGMFDLVSGKLKDQNELLRLNAELRSLNLKAEAAEASTRVRDLSDGTRASAGSMVSTGIAATYNQEIGQDLYKKSQAARERITGLLDGVLAGTVEADRALREVSADDLKGLNVSLEQYREAITAALSARLKGETAAAIDQSLRDGRLAESLRKPDTSKPKKDQSSDEAKKLVDFYDRAEERIQRINERFGEQPKLVTLTAQAMRELDAIVKDLSERKPVGFEKLIEQANAARTTVQDALLRPFNDYVEKAKQQEQIDRLLIKGKMDQAAVLQEALRITERTGQISREQLQTIQESVYAERERTRELEKSLRKQDAYLNAVNGIRGAVTNGVSGLLTGNGGDMISDIGDQLANLFATRLTDRLFGGIFDSLTDQIERGGEDVRDATDVLVEVLAALAIKVEAAGNAIAATANSVAAANGSGPIAAANDNGAAGIYDVLVTGSRRVDPIDELGGLFDRLFEKTFGQGSNFSKTLGDLAQGAGLGLGAGQLLLGSSNSKLGSMLGGALGEVAGEAIGKKVGGLLGDALGPLGSIAGGLLGGALGGIFNKTPMGSAIATGNGYDASITASGNTAIVQSLTGMSQGLQQNLQRIADQFGAELGNYAVSFGQRGSYYRVAGTATTAVGNKHPSRTAGIELLYDGEDAETAMRMAILNALQDGAVKGIKEGTKRLLQAGTDLEANLSKALRFEQVFKDLRRYTDPVGSAIDELNVKFRQLQQIFREAGASADEFAQLQQLYDLERADSMKQVTEQLTSSLKNLLSQLTTGDSGLSLRARLANAMAEYNPLRGRVAAGDASAYDAYAAAAQTMLDLQRQIYGSGTEYFASLEEVTALTRAAILTQEAKINAANDTGSPFDTTPIVNATQNQTQALLAGLQPLLSAIAANSAAAAQGASSSSYSQSYYSNALAKAANF